MSGILKVRKAIPLLVAVPTTAGTGSETTLAAVVDSQTHHKFAINDFPLIPSYAVLNESLTASGRAFSKAYVGYVHALAHPLGGKYNVAHGLANAVILPVVLREYGKAIYRKLWEVAVFCDTLVWHL